MSNKEVADRYVTLCKEGRFEACLDELFSNEAVSVEAWAPPGTDLVATGLAAIRAKGERWGNNHNATRSMLVCAGRSGSASFRRLGASRIASRTRAASKRTG